MRRFKGRFTHNGFGMSAWDYVGFAVAAGALLAIVAPIYLERKKHERTQEIFAPSLREELDRGLAQLDFAVGLESAPRVMRIITLLSIAVMMMSWRRDALPATRRRGGRGLHPLFCVLLGGCAGFAGRKTNEGTGAGAPTSAGIDARGSGRGSQ